MNTVSSTTNVDPRARTAHISGLAGTLLAATLPAWFALVPAQALAVPDETGGTATTVNVLVPTVGPAAWTTLGSQPVIGPRFCAATCSADMLNPGGVLSNFYRFHLTVNPGAGGPVGGPIDTGCERTLHFFNQGAVLDNRTKEITTTCFFRIPQGGLSTIRCRATKFTAATANVIVDDSSLSVACSDTQLP